MTKKEAQRNAALNGGRGSGQTVRLIYEIIADLKKENRLLGERCNQLLKDKGELTDKCRSLEEVVKEYIRIKTGCFSNEDDVFIAERDLLENAISVLRGVEEK